MIFKTIQEKFVFIARVYYIENIEETKNIIKETKKKKYLEKIMENKEELSFNIINYEILGERYI